MTAARERLGEVIGWLSAPVFGAIARARHARVFHPEGVVLSARVEPLVHDGPLGDVAARLAGPALVRLSTALWRHGKEWPDALGCAIRFRDVEEPDVEPAPGDQDMLFATVRAPVLTPFGPVGTHVHDFLANTYFATAPFDVASVGRARLRLVPDRPASPLPGVHDRVDRLVTAVRRGDAALRLELRRTWHPGYAAVARVVLRDVVRCDQDRLRFSPFRAGRGIEPRGFVHALRHGAYAASQAAGHPHSSKNETTPVARS